MLLIPPRKRVRTRSLAPVVSASALAAASGFLPAMALVSPSELKPSKVRLRKHPEQQIEQLQQSLRTFSQVLPIMGDGKNNVIAGEALLEAAKRNGMAKVWFVRIEHLSDPKIRALRIALNKLATLSSWNEPALKAELEFLSSISFDLPLATGFSNAEIDVLTSMPSEDIDECEKDDALSLPDQAVSRPGDIFAFQGGHRLGCLNALVEASFAALMGHEKAGLEVSDPPFNVPIRGHVTDRAGAREFAMASGELSSGAFTEFLKTSFRHSAAYLRGGALSMQFMDWRHINEMMAAGQAVFGELFQLAVWAKTNPGMGAPWRSAHELCFVWKNGNARHIDNVKLGQYGRNRSNVWSYPGANQHRDSGSEGHVTPKNLAMIRDAILDVSNRGDIVLDAFAGSATTLVAAHLTRRRGYGLEIDPAFVDLGVRRMESRTKAPARHLDTGRTFAETAADRGVPLPSPARAR